MNIISYAWTVDALLAGLKDVTRRDWPDKYAAQFKPGDLVQAYDKSARCGGKCRAIVRLEDVRREPLSRLTDDPAYGRAELIREGNLWPSLEAFLALFGKLKHGDPYRVQFKLVEIVGKQASLPLRDAIPAVHAEFCNLTGQQLKLSIFQTYWKELLHTHGFTPDDVTATARYLVRQVKQGKRMDGCLKIFNFAAPVQFASDLALARRAEPLKSAPQPVAAPVMTEPTVDPVAHAATRKELIADLRAKLRGGPAKA